MGVAGRKRINGKTKLVDKTISLFPKQEAKWICLNVAERYKRSNEFKNAIFALKKTFGKDCIHLLVIGQKLDDTHYFNEMDGYVFLKCYNVESYIEDLKGSKFIESILCSYENISFIANSEIKSMVSDYKSKQKDRRKKTEICYGDMVDIKSGKYENLTGVVTDKIDDKYLVTFSFNFGIQKEKILYENMVKKNNIFDKVKCPV